MNTSCCKGTAITMKAYLYRIQMGKAMAGEMLAPLLLQNCNTNNTNLHGKDGTSPAS